MSIVHHNQDSPNHNEPDDATQPVEHLFATESEPEPTTIPSIYEMRNGLREPRDKYDADRLAWSYWS